MSFANLKCHLVWSTKNREKLLSASIRDKLFKHIGGITKKRKHVLLAAGGIEDHIHLLVGFHQTGSVSDYVRDVKSNSTSWIKKNFQELTGFAWQTKYGAFSVSQSNVDDVKQYIQRQEEHHKKISYQEEFLMLLKKHGIPFDRKFVWE